MAFVSLRQVLTTHQHSERNSTIAFGRGGRGTGVELVGHVGRGA